MGMGVVVANPDDAVALLEGMTGVLNILDRTGHSRMQWNENKPDQVRAAKARFDEFKAKGYIPYKVDASGQRTNEVIHTFDPSAERVDMTPPMVGG